MRKKNTLDLVGFSNSLKKLCLKHGILMDGRLRIRTGDEWDESAYSISIYNHLEYGYAKDTSGPFLGFNSQKKYVKTQRVAHSSSPQIVDKDKLVRHGVKSMADGQTYSSRHEWNEMLKRNHMVEVGDQASAKPNTEIRGDFSVRDALKQAVQQHLG